MVNRFYLHGFMALIGLTLLFWVSVGKAEMTARQTQLLVNNCIQCHAEPRTGAPLMGDIEVWKERYLKGEDAVLVNVVNGMGSMPPLGYCSACDEEDFRAIIRMLAGQPADQRSKTGGSGETK